MSISGIPSTKFTKPVAASQSLREVYDILFSAWSVAKVDRTAPLKNLENCITWCFYSAIVAEIIRLIDDGTRQHCFTIFSGTSIIYRRKQVGIADIQVEFNNDPRCRFIIEAKLLNKKGASNARAYVGEEGMGRFISGKKYGIEVSEGGMIGYVLDGNTDKARKSVADKIEKERQTVGMLPTATLKNSTIREDVYETSHVKQTGTSFTIYHIFLPVKN